MKIEHLPYEIDESKSKNHFYETYWKVRALDLLGKYVPTPNGISLLDYGCGRGETMKLASASGYITSGADVDEACLALSKQWGATYKISVDESLCTTEKRTYDVVTCFHVLEHVPNPSKVLRELCEISNKYVVLAVPNLRQLYGLRRNPNMTRGVNTGHLQGWDHWHLLNMATNHAGLKLVAWTSDATILPIISHVVNRTLGMRAAIYLETRIFNKLFPNYSVSIIGLFEKA